MHPKDTHMARIAALRKLERSQHGDPVICSHFGCSKYLSATEQLYTNRCFEHSDESLTHTILVKNYFLTIKIKR